MKQKFWTIVLVVAALALMNDSKQASATESYEDIKFESIKDWNVLKDGGTGYIPIVDVFNLGTFSWNQTIEFDPAAAEITSATLTLTHKLNADINNQWSLKGEIWVLSAKGSGLIGELSSSNNKWKTDTFDIFGLLESFSGESITLTLKLSETTQWMDLLWLDKCVISGTYNTAPAPVPIPGAALLLGSGLLGLIGVGTRRKEK